MRRPTSTHRTPIAGVSARIFTDSDLLLLAAERGHAKLCQVLLRTPYTAQANHKESMALKVRSKRGRGQGRGVKSRNGRAGHRLSAKLVTQLGCRGQEERGYIAAGMAPPAERAGGFGAARVQVHAEHMRRSCPDATRSRVQIAVGTGNTAVAKVLLSQPKHPARPDAMVRGAHTRARLPAPLPDRHSRPVQFSPCTRA